MRAVRNIRLPTAALACWALLAGICAPLTAQTGAAATVTIAEGQVSTLRDGQMWALFVGNQIGVGQTILTGDDGFAQLEVADGSTFLVYPNSRVVFRKNPGNLKDLVDIFLGRVRIFIRRFGGQPNPHRIYTPTAVISVRGTIFDVAVDEDETTTVSVEEGLVGVEHRLLPRGKETPVPAGQSLVIYRAVPIARAFDSLNAARIGEDIARTAASIWSRIGGNRAPGGVGGAGGAGLPGDTPAPAPPLPGDEEAPAPPPAPAR